MKFEPSWAGKPFQTNPVMVYVSLWLAAGRTNSKILIVLYSDRATSFRDLNRALRGITSKALSDKLKKLRVGGLVSRKVIDPTPPGGCTP